MILREQFIGRRPWVFTQRCYSPRGWRVPRCIWQRMGYGRSVSFHKSHLASWLGCKETLVARLRWYTLK